MAQETSPAPAKPAWTKIFTAFKVALDLKKLALAAAGIFFAWTGWAAISWTFYGVRGDAPVYVIDLEKKKDEKDVKAEWNRFKSNRASWNLIHELAGSPSDHKPVDAGDVASDVHEYVLLDQWSRGYLTRERLADPIVISGVKDSEAALEVPKLAPIKLTAVDAQAKAELPSLQKAKLTVRAITLWVQTVDKMDEQGKPVKDDTGTVQTQVIKGIEINNVKFNVESGFEKLKEAREVPMELADIEKAAAADVRPVAKAALKTFREHLITPRIKPSGRLRISPWSENRGENPYLIVAMGIKTRGESIAGGGKFLSWLISDQMPVLLEPLYKFLTPIVSFFDPRAGVWDRLYLIFIILWTLAVWGFFGGAICRIAAVQVARNERITLKEAVLFTRERFVSYLAAPAFPLALVAILTIVLIVFGWIEWIPWLGDLFAGLFWPVVILLGFIMAIVLLGLVGWPLMTATISTEGTDSFDALSRSYSYVYQAPWQYLWYNFLAVVYGAALVFFIGFMASLMVFLGKWGVSSAPGLAKSTAANDREPSYLFYYAPTSFGWRNLLISSSQFVETKTEITPDGRKVDRLEFKPEYEKEITGANRFGATLVSVWIYLLFLLVVGFGYSYFWSASTIIYFLMRQHVDDTPLDEVHQEDEDLDDPFLKSAPAAPAPPAAPAQPQSKPGTVSLNVVEAPPAASPAPPENPPPGGNA